MAIQKPKLHGPPMYYTQDWNEARDSVNPLAQLEPELVVTGHGLATQGPEMRTALHQLVINFDSVAVLKIAATCVIQPASKVVPRIANHKTKGQRIEERGISRSMRITQDAR